MLHFYSLVHLLQFFDKFNFLCEFWKIVLNFDNFGELVFK